MYNITVTDSLGNNFIDKINIDFNNTNTNTNFNYITDNNIIKANVYGSLDTLLQNVDKFVDNVILEKNNDTIFFPSVNLYADIKEPYELLGENFTKNFPQFSELFIDADYNNKSENLRFKLYAPDFKYQGNTFDSTFVDINGNKYNINYVLTSNILIDSMLNTKLFIDGEYKNRELLTHINLSDKNKTSDFLNLKLLSKTNKFGYVISILNDSLNIISNKWTIKENNSFSITKHNLIAENIKLNRANKQLKIFTDTINGDIGLNMQNIDLSVFNNILSNDTMLAGNLNTNMKMSYKNNIKNLSLYAKIDSFMYNNYKIGNIIIDKALLNSNYFAFNSSIKNKNDSVKLNGIINLTDDKKININTNINSLNLGLVNSFLSAYLYNAKGIINSKIKFTGTIEQPIFNGYIAFNEASFGLVDLKEEFKISNNKINFKNDKVFLDDINIIDKNGHKTNFTGNIQYIKNDIVFNNLTMKSESIELMNSKQSDDEPLFGLVMAELNLYLNGSINKLNANSKIIIDYPTNLSYIFSENLSVKKNDNIVNFTKIDTLNIIDSVLIKKTEYKNRLAMFKSLNAELVVKGGCKFNIYFDNSLENYLNVSVNGDVKYIINNNIPKTYGLLNIDKGNMSYSLPMVTMDKLKIEEGSYIQISNNIENPNLTINSSTKIWAQTGSLVENYNRNIEVTVFMYMRGNLDNLIIQFDVSPITNDPVISSKISQMTAKERSVNAVNLLIRGQFATNQSAVAIDVDSYINQMLANGLNTLISDRIKFVDMSFDIKSYQNYNSKGAIEEQSNIFFNVGKSFYHDRLRVKYTSSLTSNTTKEGETYGQMEQTTQSNLSLEYDINKRGTFQGLLFRKNAYDDIMEGDIISTGGGFRLRKTYKSFGDIFKYNKNKK